MQESGSYGNILKRTGLKNTRHRNAVLDVMENSDQPISADQIFLVLKDRKYSINMSSVYRILESLLNKELIIKSNIIGESKASYELNRLEHKHRLICSGCKRMFSIYGCPLKEYEKLLKDRTGFEITGHKLEIFGFCKECKQRGSTAADCTIRD